MELSLDRKGQIAVVKFLAPSLSRPFLQELSRAMKELEEDEGVRAVIFTGQRNIFMTGACLSEIVSLNSREAALAFLELPHVLVRLFCSFNKLLIAAINGYCLGGGLELALTCDFRIMVDKITTIGGETSAYTGFPEVQLGLIPAVGGAYLASEVLGAEKARELFLTARHIVPEDALRMGLVCSVVAQPCLLPEAEALANQILANSWSAVVATKELVRQGRLAGLEAALRATALAFAECCENGELKERIRRANAQERERLRRQVQLNHPARPSLQGTSP